MNDLRARLEDKYGPWVVVDGKELTAELTRYLIKQVGPQPDYYKPCVMFGGYVEALRKRKGLSRPEMAKAAQLPPVYYAILEVGGLGPEDIPVEVVENIFEALGIPLREVAITPWDGMPLMDGWLYRVSEYRGIQRLSPIVARLMEDQGVEEIQPEESQEDK